MTDVSAGRRSLPPFSRHEWALVVAILACLVVTTLADRQNAYLERPWDCAREILRQTVMLGIFALGSAIVIVSGGIDLSCGSMIAFGGTVCAATLLWLTPEAMASGGTVEIGWGPIGLSIVATLVSGFLVGSLHTWLITVVGLPPFVATLATLVGLRSLGRAVVQSVTKNSTQIQIQDANFRYLAQDLRISTSIFVGVALLTWLLMSRTVTGRHIYALGGNEEAARLCGIRTDRLKWLAYSLGAMLSSLAGVLYVADSSTAYPEQTAVGYELFAIAAAVVGGCSLKGGVGAIPGAVLGCVFLRLVIDGVGKLIDRNAATYEGMIVGVVVVLAVAFGQFRAGKGRVKRFFAGPLGIAAIVTFALLAGLAAMIIAGSQQMLAWVALATAAVLGAFKWFERRFAGNG